MLKDVKTKGPREERVLSLPFRTPNALCKVVRDAIPLQEWNRLREGLAADAAKYCDDHFPDLVNPGLFLLSCGSPTITRYAYLRYV